MVEQAHRVALQERAAAAAAVQVVGGSHEDSPAPILIHLRYVKMLKVSCADVGTRDQVPYHF